VKSLGDFLHVLTMYQTMKVIPLLSDFGTCFDVTPLFKVTSSSYQ
jgi:hypothetical protein